MESDKLDKTDRSGINKTRFYGLLLISILIFGFITIYFSPGPRGSDQYWNIGNVERVIKQDGLYRTNNIFPAGLPGSLNELPRPWVQNRPVVYLVVIMAKIVGDPHLSWVVMNCLFLLLTLYLIFRILKLEGNDFKGWIIVTMSLFLFIPLNYYLGMQALPELFNELLAILIAFILISRINVHLKAVLAAIVTGILIYQRDNFLLLLLLITIYFFVFEKGKQKYSSAGIYLLAGFVFVLIKPYILPGHTIKPIPVLSLITEVRKGNSNMVNYLFPDMPQQSLLNTIRILLEKSWRAIAMQFAPGGEDAVFRYPVNFLLLPLIVLISRFRTLSDLKKKIVFLSSGFVLIHFITIMVFENQYRFSSILIPLLLICAFWFGISMKDKYRKISLYGAVFILIMFLAADIIIGRTNLKEVKSDKKFVEDIRRYKHIIGNETVLVPYYGGKSLIIGYGISPNYCYYFASHMSREKLWEDAEMLNATLVIYPENIRFSSQIKNLIIEQYPIGNKHILARIRSGGK